MRSLQSALTHAGFTVVGDGSRPHDLTGTVEAGSSIEQSRVPSQFQMFGLGAPQRRYRISLSLEANGQVVDQFETELAADTISEASLHPVVVAMTSSARLEEFAETLDAAARQATTAAAASEAEAQSKWNAIVGECRAPKSAASCDTLRAWDMVPPPALSIYSTATPQTVQLMDRRREAESILSASAPAIKTLGEADLWAHANLNQCAATVIREDCANVSAYINQFPDGTHFAQATQVYAEADKRISAAEERERRRAEAQQRAVERQQQRQACKAGCGTSTCAAFTTEDRRAQCVTQCEQGCGE
jgi:hypothetical protein